MIFKKDNFLFGCILGFIAPIVGIIIFKNYKFRIFSYKEVFQFLFYEPGHAMLSVALTLSLLLNALFFTIYVNTGKDNTAKGIFVTTVLYGIIVLLIKL